MYELICGALLCLISRGLSFEFELRRVVLVWRLLLCSLPFVGLRGCAGYRILFRCVHQCRLCTLWGASWRNGCGLLHSVASFSIVPELASSGACKGTIRCIDGNTIFDKRAILDLAEGPRRFPEPSLGLSGGGSPQPPRENYLNNWFSICF